jgi:hypothetical protein
MAMVDRGIQRFADVVEDVTAAAGTRPSGYRQNLGDGAP